jgi:hypothetical protein
VARGCPVVPGSRRSRCWRRPGSLRSRGWWRRAGRRSPRVICRCRCPWVTTRCPRRLPDRSRLLRLVCRASRGCPWVLILRFLRRDRRQVARMRRNRAILPRLRRFLFLRFRFLRFRRAGPAETRCRRCRLCPARMSASVRSIRGSGRPRHPGSWVAARTLGRRRSVVQALLVGRPLRASGILGRRRSVAVPVLLVGRPRRTGRPGPPPLRTPDPARRASRGHRPFRAPR